MRLSFRAALSILCGIALPSAADASRAAEPLPGLPERFAQPPADARIHKIIHGWPDKAEAQDKLIARLHSQGFGGVVCNVSFDQYMESETKWTAFLRGVGEAEKAGFALWLYDERGYPSGNAGGITLRGRPEWEAQGLLVADAEVEGTEVSLAVPPGELYMAAAYPLANGVIDPKRAMDLTGFVRDGRLRWRPPHGRWRALLVARGRLYEGTHADGNLYSKIPYINLLMPGPTERFVEATYGAYAARLGTDLGRHFMATFTDEPSLMSLYLRPMPYRPLPWALELPEAFRERRGYALGKEVVAALIADAGPAGERMRHDYWRTVGELVAENFFGKIQTRCRALNVPSGGHLLMEESLVAHTPLYGDFFRCLRRLDAPSIDCLTSIPSQVPWFIARLVASAAELEGRSLVMSETSDHSQRYRPAGDKRPVRAVTEEEIRGTCNRQIVSGVNDITSYYSFAGLSDEQIRRLNAWVGRCCTMLRGGHQVADIAMLYPTESVWTKFVPSRLRTQDAAAASRIEASFRAASEALFAARRDFTYVDSRALAESRVEEGELVHGKLRWRVVVLPQADTLPRAAWDKLGELVRSGGVVVALGALPRNSDTDFPSSTALELGEELFGGARLADGDSDVRFRCHASGGLGVYLPRGLDALLPAVLDTLLEADVAVSDVKAPLRATHRRIEGRDVYFLINDSAAPWSGEVTVPGAGAGERWNPETGRMEETIGRKVRLSFAPFGGQFLRYETVERPRRIVSAMQRAKTKEGLRGAEERGRILGFEYGVLPASTPTEGHGKHVKAATKSDRRTGTAQVSAWRFRAVLTEDGVDNHLFAQFRYTPALDLSAADCLVIDTWVPEGQRTPCSMLVIVHEEGGGDFIAETGRPLGAAGRERLHIPLDRFHLAGWSKDADGQLDARRIKDVRIGWGGYFGGKDEVVEFSVAAPRAGTLDRTR